MSNAVSKASEPETLARFLLRGLLIAGVVGGSAVAFALTPSKQRLEEVAAWVIAIAALGAELWAWGSVLGRLWRPGVSGGARAFGSVAATIVCLAMMWLTAGVVWAVEMVVVQLQTQAGNAVQTYIVTPP